MNRTLLILSTTALVAFARLNPFEPVESPNIQVPAQTLEPIPVTEKVMSIDDGDRTVKIKSDEPLQPLEPQVIIQEKIVEKKPTKDELEAECKILDANKTVEPVVEKVIEEKIPEPVVVPKLVEKVYKPLPFLTLDLKKNILVIDAREKYKIIKYYTITDENKIVIDFEGNVKHYTKKDSFISEEFDTYTIGNHPKENFFRVVITTKKHPNEYLPVIKNNMITLKYEK